MTQSILITGGAGFVGSHLADRLVGLGHRVTVLDDLSSGARDNVPPGAQLVVGDVCDPALVERLIGENEACFHLAAIASVPQCDASWRKSHAVNQAAFVALLENIAKRKNGVIPVVYASSAAVYGDAATFPVHEDLPLRPLSIYGADKAGCELQAHAAGAGKGVPTFGLRPFNIYGPRQNAASPYSGVITQFAERLRRGEALTIYGDGKQTRDFICITDIVDHFIAALAKASPQAPVCNAATGNETSVLAVVETLSTLFGRKPDIHFASPRAGDIYRSVADTRRAQALLSCTARVTMQDGLSFLRP